MQETDAGPLAIPFFEQPSRGQCPGRAFAGELCRGRYCIPERCVCVCVLHGGMPRPQKVCPNSGGWKKDAVLGGPMGHLALLADSLRIVLCVLYCKHACDFPSCSQARSWVSWPHHWGRPAAERPAAARKSSLLGTLACSVRGTAWRETVSPAGVRVGRKGFPQNEP